MSRDHEPSPDLGEYGDFSHLAPNTRHSDRGRWAITALGILAITALAMTGNATGDHALYAITFLSGGEMVASGKLPLPRTRRNHG